MGVLIHRHSAKVRGPDGTTYEASVYGAQRADGTWEGWIEFNPLDRSRPRVRTEQETSQPDRAAVVYWAGGLQPVYLEGALERALRTQPVSRSRSGESHRAEDSVTKRLAGQPPQRSHVR